MTILDLLFPLVITTVILCVVVANPHDAEFHAKLHGQPARGKNKELGKALPSNVSVETFQGSDSEKKTTHICRNVKSDFSYCLKPGDQVELTINDKDSSLRFTVEIINLQTELESTTVPGTPNTNWWLPRTVPLKKKGEKNKDAIYKQTWTAPTAPQPIGIHGLNISATGRKSIILWLEVTCSDFNICNGMENYVMGRHGYEHHGPLFKNWHMLPYNQWLSFLH